MNKLLAVLVAGLFSAGAFAASHAGAPMAGASAPKAEAKAEKKEAKADAKAAKKEEAKK